jgi:hypothetical protein
MSRVDWRDLIDRKQGHRPKRLDQQKHHRANPGADRKLRNQDTRLGCD